MPHTITTVITITRISLHTNGKGEEKITKTDKHHGTPTTRKLLPSKAGSLWQALRQCPLRTKAGTCGDTPNGNETALLAWLQRLQKNSHLGGWEGEGVTLLGERETKTPSFSLFSLHMTTAADIIQQQVQQCKGMPADSPITRVASTSREYLWDKPRGEKGNKTK